MRATALFPLLLHAPIAAQSFNVDVGYAAIHHPVPADAYGAAAAQTGRWNAVATPYTATLAHLDGSASTVSVASDIADVFAHVATPLSGDDAALMADCQDLATTGGPYTWTIVGLVEGAYRVYTYAREPFGGARTRVWIPGSPDPAQDVGGDWTGSPHVLGRSYALHRVLLAGAPLQIGVAGLDGAGAINGFQIVRDSPLAFCFGDGSGAACPCGNAGAAGRGCANSVDPAGALLAATGYPSIAADTLVLNGSGMPDAAALYFQGTARQAGGAGVPFGDGLRCAGGTVVRLAIRANSGGASSYPGAGDARVSVPGGAVAGDVRTYQVWYRNAASFCTPSPFNLSNGIAIRWEA